VLGTSAIKLPVIGAPLAAPLDGDVTAGDVTTDGVVGRRKTKRLLWGAGAAVGVATLVTAGPEHPVVAAGISVACTRLRARAPRIRVKRSLPGGGVLGQAGR